MKMASTNFTSKEFGRRFRKALSVPFIFDQACSEPLQQFIKSYADSIGCNEKCIFFPLLSCCAACVGPNAYLELTTNWHEPLIIWTLVVTPMTLHRIDVAEHLKQELIAVQDELNNIKTEDAQVNYPKFVVDVIALETFQEMLKCNDGQALGIYNTTKALHKMVPTPEDAGIMQKLHLGFSWFQNSRMSKKLVSRTHVNFSVLSSPSSVHHSLTTNPNFYEVYNDCFLTVCAEDNHVKFSQLAAAPACENIQRIFKDIITLHSTHKIVYKLSKEAAEKFGTIHDEITDKAKQLARKNSTKVFNPALSCLARISCVLHVLDNVLEAINYAVPVDPCTWNVEISADNMWHARQVLGYVIEQKFSLSQPTMMETTPSKVVESVVVDDSPGSRPQVRTNLFRSPQRFNVSPSRYTPVSPRNLNFSPNRTFNSAPNSSRFATVNSQRSSSSSDAFDLLLASSNTNNSANTSTSQNDAMMISEVRSAGVPVPADKAFTESSTVTTPASSSNLNTSSNQPATFTAQSIALMSEDEFCLSFQVQIKRILTHGLREISLNRCLQLGLAPRPKGGYQSSEQRVSVSRIFLKRLETLGFGTVVGPKGAAGSKHCVFKKHLYASLGSKQHKMLSDMMVSEQEYDKCFTKAAGAENGQNGIVCLE